MFIVMAATHTKTVLNKLSKPGLVETVMQTEARLNSQIVQLQAVVQDLLEYFKKL